MSSSSAPVQPAAACRPAGAFARWGSGQVCGVGGDSDAGWPAERLRAAESGWDGAAAGGVWLDEVMAPTVQQLREAAEVMALDSDLPDTLCSEDAFPDAAVLGGDLSEDALPDAVVTGAAVAEFEPGPVPAEHPGGGVQVDVCPGPVPEGLARWVRREWWQAPVRAEVRRLMLLAPGVGLIAGLSELDTGGSCPVDHGHPDAVVEAADPTPVPG
ncbi:MAG: hypothetical protein KDC23_12715, partial [Actinobacteria bacterium]|nr:hypothetical protein [Actinomycetota bacterium]